MHSLVLGEHGLYTGKYGSSITMWGENLYINESCPCATTYRLDMTQVISNPRAQVLEAFHFLHGTTIDYNCEVQLTGATPGDAH